MAETIGLTESILLPLLPSILQHKGNITAAALTDMNSYTQTGLYFMDAQGATDVANAPQGVKFAGLLIVIDIPSRMVCQTYIPAWGPSSLFFRSRWYGTWKNWLKVATVQCT